MNPHVGTGYVTDSIDKKVLKNFTVTYDKCGSCGGWVEANITYGGLTDM